MRTCRRCRGSGWLLRPKPGKTIHFKKCTDCGGHGSKPAPKKSEELIGSEKRKRD